MIMDWPTLVWLILTALTVFIGVVWALLDPDFIAEARDDQDI